MHTNSGSKLFVCATPVPSALTAEQYAVLPWVQVKGVGSFGETGSITNILSYDTLEGVVVGKGKGMTNAGDPEIELAYDGDDPGQNVLRSIALTKRTYALKVERNDRPDDNPGSTPTIRYNRGLIDGPRQPNGRNEDFDLDVFTLALQQRQITVPAKAGSLVPTNSLMFSDGSLLQFSDGSYLQFSE